MHSVLRRRGNMDAHREERQRRDSERGKLLTGQGQRSVHGPQKGQPCPHSDAAVPASRLGKANFSCSDYPGYWESQFLGRLIRSSGVPKERGVWNSQGGGKEKHIFPSTFLQFSSAQSCPTLCDPMNCSKPASQSITNSRSSLKLTSIESVMYGSRQWCHPAISSSVIPFSSCPKSRPASESFPMSQRLAWGGQSTGASALASFPPKNTQGWSPSEWTGWISLQSKGLSGVFSNTTVQKHQFLGTQLSSQSNSHIHTYTPAKSK